jgi:hypothetical protein
MRKVSCILKDAANFGFLASLSQALSSLGYFLSVLLYNLIISLPVYLLLAVMVWLAGLFAARKTNKASTGMLAGLWVGLYYVIVDLLGANIALDLLVVFPQIVQNTSSLSEAATLERTILINGIIYSLGAGLVLIGLSVGIGALAGAAGKGNAAPASAYAAPAYQMYQAPPPLYGDPQQVPYGQQPRRSRSLRVMGERRLGLNAPFQGENHDF